MIGSTSLCSAKRDNFCEKNKSAETDTSANKLNSRKLFIITIIEKNGMDVKGKTCILLRIVLFFTGNSTKSMKNG
ncbi:hypothetical protein [Peribacillus sp. TH14]|uniref:hypothetical protein n=1 Tax=Peribacillus sp. TH14 TaxID=2798481 RepID=UPI001A912238|nr:hypothetical protein [Peribacillus sp. TH14]